MCMVAVKDTLLKEAARINPNYSQSELIETALTFYISHKKKQADHKAFFGALKLKEDPLLMQKDFRNEWN